MNDAVLDVSHIIPKDLFGFLRIVSPDHVEQYGGTKLRLCSWLRQRISCPCPNLQMSSGDVWKRATYKHQVMWCMARSLLTGELHASRFLNAKQHARKNSCALLGWYVCQNLEGRELVRQTTPESGFIS